VDNLEIEKFKLRLKNYNFKFDDDILFKNLEPFDEKIVNEVFEDMINNTVKLNGLNIIFELKEGLKNKQTTIISRVYVTEACEICDNTGFVSLHNLEGYSFSFLCNCSTGERKKEYNPKLKVWNGKIEQFIGNKKFVLDDCLSCRLEFKQAR
jgi:hypothetical protein